MTHLMIVTAMVGLLALAAPVGLLPRTASAGHVEPARAHKASFALLNGFFECSSPNTATQSNGTPACTPAAPANACAFSPTGSGKLSLMRTGSVVNDTQDVKIVVSAKGLNEFCEGLPLDLTLSYRLTTDDCTEGSCTTVDVVNFPTAGSCIVAAGRCKLKTTLNTAAPGLIDTNGKNGGIQVLGCGLKSPFPGFAPPGIVCGILLLQNQVEAEGGFAKAWPDEGQTSHEIAWYCGTSSDMIERHYGGIIQGMLERQVGRLDSLARAGAASA